MNVQKAMSIASWLYFGVASLLLLAAVGSGRWIDRSLTAGQMLSLSVLIVASLVLGAWTRMVGTGRARLSFRLFICGFLSVCVLGATFGSLFHAFLLGVPFVFVLVAWQQLQRVERGKGKDG